MRSRRSIWWSIIAAVYFRSSHWLSQWSIIQWWAIWWPILVGPLDDTWWSIWWSVPAGPFNVIWWAIPGGSFGGLTLVVHLVVCSCWTIQHHLVGHSWWAVWWAIWWANLGGPCSSGQLLGGPLPGGSAWWTNTWWAIWGSVWWTNWRAGVVDQANSCKLRLNIAFYCKPKVCHLGRLEPESQRLKSAR